MFKNTKLSNILMFLTICQFIYAQMLASGNYYSTIFSVEHEDTIFIMHLMVWFIVRTIENLKLTVEVKDMR